MNNKYLLIIIGILAVLLAFFAIKSYIQVPYQVLVDTVDDQQDNQDTVPPQVLPVNNPPTYSTTLPQYISGQTGWPPVIQSSTTVYSCFPAVPNEVSKIVQKVISNRIYCVTTVIEGAAGSRYGEYTYTRANGAGTKTTSFTLRWPSCGVYGGPGDAQYDQCQSNQNTFFGNLDLLIDSLM